MPSGLGITEAIEQKQQKLILIFCFQLKQFHSNRIEGIAVAFDRLRANNPPHRIHGL